mgnify:CR=1 FL=1
MRKALCVGIDSYQNIADLHGCVNDANSVKSALERNGDGTLNFNVKVMCATSDDSYITKCRYHDEFLGTVRKFTLLAGIYYQRIGSICVQT